MQRFEDLDAWKRARDLTEAVYSVTSDGPCSRDFALLNQMRRAAISVMSNIAEGFERDGNKEFVQFLSIAKGSAGELKAQMYVMLDAGYVDDGQFERMYSIAAETGKLIGGLIRYLEQSPLEGTKRRTRS